MLMKLAVVLVLVSLSAACAEGHAVPPLTEAETTSAQIAGIQEEKAAPERERDLMAKALAGIAPSRPGLPEYFFVGVAGWASEDVFLNEARAAADLFRRRFGAQGRTLLLANNPATAGELPPATVPALEAAIDGIAEMMGEEDVLFLYLTSHGQRRRVGLRNGAGDLPDLGARELRRILDAAGVRNRVVAISACYSGSFIEALRDANTLVMTAAAADRPSFGCGHDGTFTYFGQALIGEALERELSFVRGFEAARTAIETREKGEGLKPSRPQIFVGGAIGPVLDEITRGLQRNR